MTTTPYLVHHLLDPREGDADRIALVDGERRMKWLKNAMGVLNPRELLILKRRRLEEETTTLEDLGNTLGISKERVRQIETRALEKLKASLVQLDPKMAAGA